MLFGKKKRTEITPCVEKALMFWVETDTISGQVTIGNSNGKVILSQSEIVILAQMLTSQSLCKT
jgi:hypothetical protein